MNKDPLPSIRIFSIKVRKTGKEYIFLTQTEPNLEEGRLERHERQKVTVDGTRQPCTREQKSSVETGQKGPFLT